MRLFNLKREGKPDIPVTGITTHAEERMKERQVRPAAVAEALLVSVEISEERVDPKGRTSVRVTGRHVEVAVSLDTGGVVSVNPLSTARKVKLGILSILAAAALGYSLHPEFRDYINGKINSALTSLPQGEKANSTRL